MRPANTPLRHHCGEVTTGRRVKNSISLILHERMNRSLAGSRQPATGARHQLGRTNGVVLEADEEKDTDAR